MHYNILSSACFLSLVIGLVWVRTLKAVAPSVSVYLICSWNGNSSGTSTVKLESSFLDDPVASVDLVSEFKDVQLQKQDTCKTNR